MPPTVDVDEIFEHLEVFEQQLRWLAASRKHQKLMMDGTILAGECGGPPTCVKCGMLRRADRVADILAHREFRVSDRIGISLFLDETQPILRPLPETGTPRDEEVTLL